ncbi:response regulator [Phreatobacter stygius]|uniref:Response regulator transcription factor n=1 Tax=Phreatobacter stygius TaxID=1940610 RepID=A0A4D7BA72_9HYPH|nr:response regulator transcription factor [Phreatobacter stygius]QCI64992.1 response regulator transcription factor [Phreatobacter stygius]
MARVLLAEDHEIVRRGIRSLLESRGNFEICAEAADGLDAVRLAIQEKPDIAIIDYSLPRLNGLEVVKQVRKVLPRIQILMFTQHDSEDLMRDILRAGVRSFLLKSEADEHLIQAVSALAMSRPYFTTRVSETMLATFIGSTTPATQLTSRERETVQLIAEGASNKRIAAELGVSVKTVETHRSTAMRKLGAKSMADLVRYAVRNKLVES